VRTHCFPLRSSIILQQSERRREKREEEEKRGEEKGERRMESCFSDEKAMLAKYGEVLGLTHISTKNSLSPNVT